MIEINNLTRRFGDVLAVNNLSLSVPQGQFFVVLGPNAAGKTTTIKTIAGLIRPSSGTVTVAGFDVQSHPMEVRRRLAYVPDFPFLYDKLTPWEFLRFTAQMFRIPDQEIEPRARPLVEQFALEPFLHKSIEGLSHGTRQRTAIVAALLHDPEVFVIDEPMVGLDPANARAVKDVLMQRCRAGMTVFLSTHQLAVAEELADRIGIIHRGQLVAVGSLQELRTQAGSEGPLEKAFLALTTNTETPTPSAQ